MLVLPERRKLVISTDAYAQVAAAIPHAKTFMHDGQQLVALHHGPDEVMVLKNIGLKAPEPIRHYYDWPGRHVPMDHQKDTAAFLTMNKRALCLNSPGTGKTISSLWAADYLLESGAVKRILIVAPLSTVQVVWGREIYQHLPHRSFELLTGDKETRRRKLDKLSQYCVINHDGFTNMSDELRDFDLVIYDEATALKSPSSQRFRTCYQWVNKHCPWLWLMTGTPISQNPTDAWALARLVNSPTVPRSFTAFRDSVMNKVTTFKWVARPDALETCKKVLQPSIRFSLDECIDLPDTHYVGRKCEMSKTQEKAFKQMQDHSIVVFQNADVSAANAAVALGKLLQICCIAEDTPVLTRAGWKAIQHINASDAVWDGEEWVNCAGSTFLGYKSVIQLAGVHMTHDHKVLSTEGWAEAKDFLYGASSKRLTRAGVRLPDGYCAGGVVRGAQQESALAVSVSVRNASGAREPVPTSGSPDVPPELRVPPWQRDAQDVGYSPLQHMDKYASSVLRRGGQRLAQLRRTGGHGVQALAGVLRGVLGGYAGRVFPAAYAWAQGQQWQVHPQELRVGNPPRASQQQAQQRAYTHTQGRHDCDAGGVGVWAEAGDHLPAHSTRKYGLASPRKVYDVVNCGPRNRFIVRGVDGQLSIVHNCGVLYGNDHERIAIDCTPRYNAFTELVDEIGDKVIVFCPLRGVQEWLFNQMSAKGYDVAIVNGDTSKADRNTIFSTFQDTEKIRVLLAHPRVAAHGLTLTRAKDIIWYAPIYSLEQYEQANARIRRLTTSGKTTVWHLYATAFEAELYRRLRAKQRVLGDFLNLIRGVNEDV